MAAPANLLSNLVANRVQKKDDDPKKLFKMKKFSHAGPKVDSWWTLPPGANTIANFHDEYEKQNTFESEPISSQKSTTKKSQSKKSQDNTTEYITEEEYRQYTENLSNEEIPKDKHQLHPCHCRNDNPEEIKKEVHYHCKQEIPEEGFSYEYVHEEYLFYYYN
ncbi:hypothetical protein PIROE2DRAFT_13023 [Piromyces sp. E2]|nr:hypothetical protein PIROE2DRAFT_13023 [Piromyces sp. E2]|eukprot:OUM61069.1 hypothetical protein PIROE2DRAFT_13023 [Piromyces sp. E2]